jgi:hypothetical protein
MSHTLGNQNILTNAEEYAEVAQSPYNTVVPVEASTKILLMAMLETA